MKLLKYYLHILNDMKRRTDSEKDKEVSQFWKELDEFDEFIAEVIFDSAIDQKKREKEEKIQELTNLAKNISSNKNEIKDIIEKSLETEEEWILEENGLIVSMEGEIEDEEEEEYYEY